MHHFNKHSRVFFVNRTSVTIDGIRFIIDSGKVKEISHNTQTSVSKLSEFWVSKSSAKQRAGRAGRTGPGKCFRLYSKKEYEAFNDFPVPEILRMSLDSIILQIATLQLGNPLDFKFVEGPKEKCISDSTNRLQLLGCITEEGSVTNLGRIISTLPMDAVLGKMLVLGSVSNLLGPVLTLVAVLSVQSPFARVSVSETTVLELRNGFQSMHGDSFTLLNLFAAWLEVKVAKNQSTRTWCKARAVEEQRLYEIVKLKSQYLKNLRDNTTLISAEFQEVEGELQRFKRRFELGLLEKRKFLAAGRKRKFLRVDDLSGSDVDEEETIAESEFRLNNNAESLLYDSDVAFLSENDLSTLKIIMVSGLYPNIAIPDKFNYNRPPSEKVYHTKSKRFANVLPNSVFTYCPELVTDNTLLYFAELTETRKVYLEYPCTIEALPVAILIAHRIDLCHDFKKLIMDEWIEFEFQNAEELQNVLVFGSKLRYEWVMAVQSAVSPDTTSTQEYSISDNIGQIDCIPACIKLLRANWIKSSMTSNPICDISSQLEKFSTMNCTYTVRKLKSSSIVENFGFTFEQELGTVFVTPHIRYHIQRNHWDKLSHIKVPLPVIESRKALPIKVPDSKMRKPYHCQNCDKTFLFTSGDIEKHLTNCAMG